MSGSEMIEFSHENTFDFSFFPFFSKKIQLPEALAAGPDVIYGAEAKVIDYSGKSTFDSFTMLHFHRLVKNQNIFLRKV